MSSPIGHSLAGYVIASIKSKSLLNRNIFTVLLFAFVANAPDLDFIPGILIGKPNLYHHGISHSIGMGIVFSSILAFIFNFKKMKNFKRDFFIFFSLFGSHLILDYLSYDSRSPIGIPLFWPFSQQYFIFPDPILPPILHSKLDHASITQFLSDVFSFHNLYVIGLEILIMLPIILIVIVLKLYSKPNLNKA